MNTLTFLRMVPLVGTLAVAACSQHEVHRPPAVPQRLVAGDVRVHGLTTDGFAVYSIWKEAPLWAVPIDGGEPIRVAADFFDVQVRSSVVFIWRSDDPTRRDNDVGTLSAWSARHGLRPLLEKALSRTGDDLPVVVDNSGDGEWVMCRGALRAGDRFALYVLRLDGSREPVAFRASRSPRVSAPWGSGAASRRQPHCPTGT